MTNWVTERDFQLPPQELPMRSDEPLKSSEHAFRFADEAELPVKQSRRLGEAWRFWQFG
jgi:hypothetical protein